jgi:fibronectin-binding autotransporter adhesin
MVRYLYITLIAIFLMPSLGFSAPDRFTYQGQIIKPDGQALEGSNVTFTIDLIEPGLPDNTACVLYSEQHTLNMTGSNGVFAIEVGSGSGVSSDYAGVTTVGDALSNAGTITAVTGGCVDYIPGLNDGRQLRLTFEDGTSGPITITQNHDIVSVPFAYSAASINGLTPADLLNRDTSGSNVLTQANLVWLFETARYTELQALINGTSTQYLSGTITSDLSIGSNRITNLGAPTAGTDAANRDYVDQNIGGNTANIGTLGPGNDGQVLTWDGSAGQFVASLPTTIDATKLPLAGGTMTGPIDMGAQNITNGNNVTIGGNMIATGGISTSGTLAFYNASDYVGFQAGASPSNQIWVLPDSDGTSGQVLTTDGSGNLAWANDSSPVTSVFSRTGAIVAQASDYTAIQIDNTPGGDIAATSVQGALSELDTEKVSVAGDNMTGALTMDAENEIRFADNAGGEYVGFKAPNTVPSSFVWDLPASDGLSGQVLTTNGSGALSFTSVLTSETQDMDDVYNNGSSVTVDTTNVVYNLTGTNSFQVQDAGTPSFIVDGSGNVGVGVSNPTSKLQVDGSIRLSGSGDRYLTGPGAGDLILSSGNVTGGARNIQFRVDGNTGTGENYQTALTLTADRMIVGGGSDPANIYGNNINGANDSFNIFLDSNTSSGVTNYVQRFTILPVTGNVGIGSNTPGGKLDVDGDIRMLGITSGYSGFQAPAAAGNNIWTLPVSDGASGQALITDGSGNLSWTSVGSGSGDLLNGGNAGAVVVGSNDNTLGLEAGGTTAITIDASSQVTMSGPLRASAGTAAAPSISFDADDDTGLYSNSADQLTLVTGGSASLMVTGASPSSIDFGRARMADGTPPLPAFSFASDPDNGMFRPAADQLAFSTNASERLRIDATGNVGIGTASPSRALHLYSSSPVIQAEGPDTPASLILYRNYNFIGNGDLIGGVAFRNNDAGTAKTAGIKAYAYSAAGNMDLEFYSGSTNYDIRNPQMTIRGQGNVGIGVYPNAKLDVNGAIRMRGAVSGYVGFLAPPTAGNNTWVLPTSDGSSGQALITDGSGNLSWTSVGSGSGDLINGGNTGAVVVGSNDSTLELEAGGSTAIYVNASGSVGIGSATPNALLDLRQTAGGGQPVIRLRDTATSNPYLQFQSGGILQDLTGGSIRMRAGTGGELTFDTNGANTRMTIDASGNVGIGTTVPGNNFEVAGEVSINAISGEALVIDQGNQTNVNAIKIINTGPGDSGIEIGPLSVGHNNGARHDFDIANHHLFYQVRGSGAGAVPAHEFFMDATAAGTLTSVVKIRSGGPGTDLLAVTQSDDTEVFKVQYDGNVGVGTDSPGGKLDVAGDIRMLGSTSGYSGFQAPATAGNNVWTLPTGDGTSGQVLSTDGSGNLSWVANSGGSTGDINQNGNSFAAPMRIGTNDGNVVQFEYNDDVKMTMGNTRLYGNGGTRSGSILMDSPGSLSAPTFSFNDDLNTGLYSSADDTLNLVTGGSERVRIDASGYVGIGTNDPTVALNLTSGSALTGLATGGRFMIGSPTAPNLVMDTNEVHARDNGASSTLYLNRYGGNVGIGTAATASKLSISQADGNSGLEVKGSDGQRVFDVGVVAADSGAFIRSYNGAGTETVRISSGNGYDSYINNGATSGLGIGTTSAGGRLDVNGDIRLLGSASGYVGLQAPATAGNNIWTLPTADGSSGQALITDGSGNLSWTSVGSGSGDLINGGNSGAVVVGSNDSTLSLEANGSTAITVNNSGRVGIGTTNPGNSLVVYTDDFNVATFRGGNIARMRLQRQTGTDLTLEVSSANVAAVSTGSNELAFMTGGSERMRLGNGGSLGIGTNLPGAKLDVNGSMRLRGSTSGYIGLRAPATAGNNIWTLPTADGSSGQALITDGSGNLSWTSLGGGGDFLANGSVAMTGDINLNNNYLSNVAGGTAGAPSINFNGDPDTGIWSQAPDSVSISTGGSEKIRVNDTGLSFYRTMKFGLNITNSTTSDIHDGAYSNFPLMKLNTSTDYDFTGIADGVGGAIVHIQNTGSGTVTFRHEDVNSLPANRFDIVSDIALNPGDSISFVYDVIASRWQTLNFVRSQASGDFLASGTVPMSGNLRLNDNWLSNDGGNEGIRINNSGYVGIGTTAPTTDLTIYGNLNGGVNQSMINPNSGTNAGTKITFTNDTGEMGQIGTYSSTFGLSNLQDRLVVNSSTGATGLDLMAIGAGDDMRFYTGGITTERMRIDGSGNVGIGTTNPTAPLHVVADDSLTFERQSAGGGVAQVLRLRTLNSSGAGANGIGSSISFNAETTSDGVVQRTGRIRSVASDATAGSIDSRLEFQTVANGSDVTAVTIDPSGDVGIGTTTPGGRLDVAGDIRMLGATSGYIGFQAPATAGNNIWTFPVSDGSSGQALITDGSGQLSWTSVGSGSGDLINGGNSGAVVVGSNDSTLSLEASGSTAITVLGNGNVGIGKSTPDAKLHVATGTAGSVSANSAADNFILEHNGFGGMTIATPDASTGSLFFGSPSNSARARIRADHNAENLSLSINSGLGLTINASNYVGIGTTSPSTKLQVMNGDIRIDGDQRFSLKDPSNTNTQGYITTNGTYGLILGTNLGDKLNIGNSGNITQDGETYRIYTTDSNTGLTLGRFEDFSAGEMPHVGTSKSSGGSYPFNEWGNLVLRPRSNTGAAIGNDISFVTGDSDQYISVINESGNMGIGTSIPGAKLDVNGDLRLRGATSGYVGLQAPATAGNNIWTLPVSDGSSGQALITDGSGQLLWTSVGSGSGDLINGGNSGAVVVGSNDSSLGLEANGSTVMTMTASGNVGIGDASPDASLEVVNDFMVSSAADNDGDLFTVTASGNVGIGTTTPSHRLEIDGTVRLSNSSPNYPTVGISDSRYGVEKEVLLEPSLNYDTGSGGYGYYTADNTVLTVGAGTTATDLTRLYTFGAYHIVNWITPVPTSQVIGTVNDAVVNAAATVGQLSGSTSNATVLGGANVSNANGSTSGVSIGDGSSVTDAHGTSSWIFHGGTGNITNGYAVYAGVQKFSSGNVLTGAGVYIDDIEANTDYGIYQAGTNDDNFFAGNVGIGTTAPGAKLDVDGDLRLRGATSGYVGLQAPAIAGNNIWTLPTGDGTSGQVLSTDGSGNLLWTTAGGGSLSAGDVIPAADGTATAPGLTFNNDSDNGMYLSGTDELSFSTAGTQRMTLTNNGRFGVGTGSPASKMTLYSNDNNSSDNVRVDNNGLDVVNVNGATGAYSLIRMMGGSSNPATAWGSFIQSRVGGTNSSSLRFGRFDNTGTASTQMILSRAGNLGVGVNPTYRLHVRENNVESMVESSNDTAANLLLANTEGTYRLSTDNNRFRIRAFSSGSDTMTVTGSSVGLGTATPLSTLDVRGDITRISGSYSTTIDNSGIQTESPSGADTRLRLTQTSTSDWSITNIASNGDLRISEDSGAMFAIEDTGNVGIGTTAPGGKLDVNGDIRMLGSTSGFSGFQAPATAGNNVWTLPTADGTSGQVLSTDGSGNLSWSTAGGGDFLASGAVAMTGNLDMGGRRINTLNSGTQGDPSISFDSDNDTGIFSRVADELNFTVAGDEAIRIDANEVEVLDDLTIHEWDSTVYSPTGSSSSPESEPHLRFLNSAGVDGSMAGMRFTVDNAASDAQNAYITAVAENSGRSPSIAIGQQTAGAAYAERMRIDAYGNVGIGTTSPGGKLDVNGDIRMLGSTSGFSGFQAPATAGNNVWTLPTADGTSGQVLSTDGSGNLSWATDGGGDLSSGDTLVAAQGSAAAPGVTFTSDTDTGLYRIGDGDMGISANGTLLANFRFNPAHETNILLTSQGGGIAAPDDLHFIADYNNSGSAGFIFGTGNRDTSNGNYDELMRIDVDTGNVGIGTTSPESTLHLAGANPTIRLRDSSNNSASNFLIYDSTDEAALIQKYNSSGDAILQIDTRPNDNTSSSQVNLFRFTNTSGARMLNFYEGDGSTTLASRIRSGGDTFFNATGGNVGIGTANPNYNLDIRSEDFNHMALTTYSDTDYSVVLGRRSRGSSSSEAAVQASDSILKVQGSAYDGSATYTQVEMVFRADENWSSTNKGTHVSFFTTENGTTSRQERVRIDHDGRMGVGTTSPSDTLHVVGDIRVGTSGSNGCLIDFGGGTITGTCSSDERFKKDIEPLESVVDRFARLSPSTYYWRADEFPDKHFGDTQQLGLIAQELQEVFPDLVVEDKDGYLKVNYTDLNMYFMKAFIEHYNQWISYKLAQEQKDKEQDQRITSVQKRLSEKDQDLQKQIYEKDKRIDELEKRLERLESLMLQERQPASGDTQ